MDVPRARTWMLDSPHSVPPSRTDTKSWHVDRKAQEHRAGHSGASHAGLSELTFWRK